MFLRVRSRLEEKMNSSIVQMSILTTHVLYVSHALS